ncbi:hypothetical protein C0J52_11392 [Blattella germanica]|nr:hypothetical protein C0J52_11392 [Blattella germanica]
MLPTVHEEFCEDDIDSEWEDFDRLVEEYRVRRRNVPVSPLMASRHYDHRKAQEQAFYPCPPPQQEEDLDYVQTVVS